MTLLAIEHLTVRYGAITALDRVSLRVDAGEIVALLGANGAGKSTVINTIIGLARAAAGRVHFAGADLLASPPSARARRGLGYSPEGRRVFPGMTVLDNLAVASFDSAVATARAIDEVFALFPVLAERRQTLGWQLSGGQQQMLAIGRALVGNPKLLLLDEPSLGLAPRLVTEVLERVGAIRDRGTAVLIAEQNAVRALEIADRAYVLELGRVSAEGRAAALAGDERVRRAFLGG